MAEASLPAIPQDVVQRIFAHGDLSLRCKLACVSKRLRDLSLSDEYWDNIELDVSELKQKGSAVIAAMLHFYARRVTKRSRLKLRCSTPSLHGDKPFSSKGCDWPHLRIVPLLMGIGINPGISRLSLNMTNIQLDAQTEILGVLPWLSALKELEVQNICMADASKLNALNKLSQIEKLSLEFDPQAAALVRQSLQGGFPEKLAGLSSLQHLSIQRAGYLGSLPEELGKLSHLQTLDLSGGCFISGLPSSFHRLTSLRAARIEQFGSSDLSALAWLPKLDTLHFNGSRMPVELASCNQLTALTLLLGNVPEHQLELSFSRMLGYSPLPEEWQQLLPQKSQFSPHLSQQLRVLHIADTKLGSVPQAVTQLPNLEHLSLTQCSLFHLPEGPYISKLQTLILRNNFFIEIPQTLKAAKVLKELDLSFNLLRPTEKDIETGLQLSRLKFLWITKTTPQGGSERYRQSPGSWTADSLDCLFKLAARHTVKYPCCNIRIHIFEPRPLSALSLFEMSKTPDIHPDIAI